MPDDTSWYAKPPAPIQLLIEAVQKHRLMFLYWATAVRPQKDSNSLIGAEYVSLDETRGWDRLFDNIDADGEFLFRQADVLNRYAERATMAFGPGKAHPNYDWHNAPNKPKPFWILNPGGAAEYLELTTERLHSSLCAARSLLHAELRITVAEAARPQGCDRWTSATEINWSFLSKLDESLAKIWIHLFCEDLERDTAALKSVGQGPGGRDTVEDSRETERLGENEPVDSAPASRSSADHASNTVADAVNSRMLQVNRAACQLYLDGQTFQFGNTKPFALLERLARRPNFPIPIETIIEDLWHSTGAYCTKGALQKTANRLRLKLENLGVKGVEVDGTSYFGLYVLKVSEICQR